MSPVRTRSPASFGWSFSGLRLASTSDDHSVLSARWRSRPITKSRPEGGGTASLIAEPILYGHVRDGPNQVAPEVGTAPIRRGRRAPPQPGEVACVGRSHQPLL